MSRWVVWCLVGLLSATSAFAAKKKGRSKAEVDDAPIPFSDQEQQAEEDERRELPERSEATRERPVETQVEEEERLQNLTHTDDPTIGLSAELVLGLMLLDASRGGVDPRFLWGVRGTWEWSRRLLTDELVREMFFVDFQWTITGAKEGTTQVFGVTTNHAFTAAPAIGYPLFGVKTPFVPYVQLGAGVAWQNTSLVVGTQETQIGGTKFLFQYGLGIRGRPVLFGDGQIKVSFRVELTRYRRGYVDDTFLGGSLGVTF